MDETERAEVSRLIHEALSMELPPCACDPGTIHYYKPRVPGKPRVRRRIFAFHFTEELLMAWADIHGLLPGADSHPRIRSAYNDVLLKIPPKIRHFVQLDVKEFKRFSFGVAITEDDDEWSREHATGRLAALEKCIWGRKHSLYITNEARMIQEISDEKWDEFVTKWGNIEPDWYKVN